MLTRKLRVICVFSYSSQAVRRVLATFMYCQVCYWSFRSPLQSLYSFSFFCPLSRWWLSLGFAIVGGLSVAYYSLPYSVYAASHRQVLLFNSFPDLNAKVLHVSIYPFFIVLFILILVSKGISALHAVVQDIGFWEVTICQHSPIKKNANTAYYPSIVMGVVPSYVQLLSFHLPNFLMEKMIGVQGIIQL